jgi:hypothetical protein
MTTETLDSVYIIEIVLEASIVEDCIKDCIEDCIEDTLVMTEFSKIVLVSKKASEFV